MIAGFGGAPIVVLICIIVFLVTFISSSANKSKYKSDIEREPDDFINYYLLFKQYMKSLDFDKAMEVANNWLERKENDVRGIRLKLIYHIIRKNYSDAQEQLALGLNLYPEDNELKFLQGLLLIQNGDRSAGKALQADCIKQNPSLIKLKGDRADFMFFYKDIGKKYIL